MGMLGRMLQMSPPPRARNFVNRNVALARVLPYDKGSLNACDRVQVQWLPTVPGLRITGYTQFGTSGVADGCHAYCHPEARFR